MAGTTYHGMQRQPSPRADSGWDSSATDKLTQVAHRKQPRTLTVASLPQLTFHPYTQSPKGSCLPCGAAPQRAGGQKLEELLAMRDKGDLDPRLHGTVTKTHGSMEQNREPRNKLTYLWSINL